MKKTLKAQNVDQSSRSAVGGKLANSNNETIGAEQ